jgi:integrase
LPRGLRPYDLRHTIATALRKAGADLADVQAHLGHSSPRITQRYAPYDATKLAQALRKVR